MKDKNVLRGIRVAIFDLDGTLFDSAYLWKEIDEVFLRRRGFTPTDEYRRAIAALGFRNTALYTIEYYGLDDTPEALMSEWTEMAANAYANDIVLFPNAREYVEACARANINIIAVTSLSRELAEAGLVHNGLMRYFSGMVTTDESGFSKSTPDIYKYAAEKSGAECRECVVFDDVEQAIIAAKQAGMHTVAVVGEHTHKVAADYSIKDLSEAPELKK